MFPYTLRLDTTRHNEFAWRERWYTRLVLEEMMRKALDPTLVYDRSYSYGCMLRLLLGVVLWQHEARYKGGGQGAMNSRFQRAVYAVAM